MQSPTATKKIEIKEDVIAFCCMHSYLRARTIQFSKIFYRHEKSKL